MPKLVLSMDGLVLKEMPLGKERTTIGRNPDNDIQIDNLAISGHHAIITCITNASVEQQSGISQVGQALQVLNQTTQQNADLVQQSASASGHLQSQASELANTVKVFKLG